MKKCFKETHKSFLKIACIIAVSLTVLQSCKKDQSEFNRSQAEAALAAKNRASLTDPDLPTLPPIILMDAVRNVNFDISNSCLNTKVQDIFLYGDYTITITDIIRKISGNYFFYVSNHLADASLQNTDASTTTTYARSSFSSPIFVDNYIVLNSTTLANNHPNFIAALILYETAFGCFPDGSGINQPHFSIKSLRGLTKEELTTGYIQPVVDYLTKNSTVLMQKEDALALAWYFLRTTDAYTNSNSPFIYTYKTDDQQPDIEISLSKNTIESRNASLLASFSSFGCN